MHARRFWPNRMARLAGGACLLAGLTLTADMVRLHWARLAVRASVAAAALAAAAELDGTAQGLLRARQAVQQTWARSVIATTVAAVARPDFAPSPQGPWQSEPEASASCWFVRVRAGGAVTLRVLPLLQRGSARVLQAEAIAGPVHAPETHGVPDDAAFTSSARLVAVFVGDKRIISPQ